ncbi:hypothetical protein [Companilactobacillus sp.]|uniref:hypothetical protein n=1 Tax=Companilactobacillus sp. TaxID=2767905 RepID=UPI0025C1D158|nr:hypothetical protein [Companilactobacillus sp.]MCH4009118.1 hypothetical protein [Companilactobacillus sp.]MCH4050703.1 hypothetical protein [Companilactobacillus sp.]MCH4077060.1 hypothetical protein [Companilactobacillus sp.]MCH4125636.1 hypothetical protein [Companilactobacillus sp.]MCI1311345.1 hypothetical protein [Companilactobacillus sp.]
MKKIIYSLFLALIVFLAFLFPNLSNAASVTNNFDTVSNVSSTIKYTGVGNNTNGTNVNVRGYKAQVYSLKNGEMVPIKNTFVSMDSSWKTDVLATCFDKDNQEKDYYQIGNNVWLLLDDDSHVYTTSVLTIGL